MTPTRRWLVRGGIAALLGLMLGAAGGVFTVNTLEPGRGNGVDSLQVMLDSIARGRLPEPAATKEPPQATAAPDSAPPAAPETILVPSVLDLEEGAARNVIIDAGLQVSEVQFRASAKPAGVVLETVPAAGSPLPPKGGVLLLLSDGRPPVDTIASIHPVPLP
jgi:hypothetical protein